ncbi:10856_t:CDS:2 [Acaulospora colombiana]|uniref:10856_t:CDS:1 n=1 Tax=Acaulospora colombiana TaxID=27376 RepID=A0ACA9NI38_9GLOM|nr:10856_t:CDS:2 [Acaulospora colombiana]
MGAGGSRQIPRKLPKHIVSEVKSSALESRSAPKSEDDIEKDGKDPHLLENLAKIGQVTLPKDRITFKQSNEMLKIVRGRQAENALSKDTLPKNRVSVQELREMLNKRNFATNEWTFEKLSSEYNLDPQVVQILLKHINTYTIERSTNAVASWPGGPENATNNQ